MNIAAIQQLVLAVGMLLTSALQSGSTTQMQAALKTAQNTIAIVQESGVLNPVTPVYYTNESETTLAPTSTPVLGATSQPPEVWTCKDLSRGIAWGWVDQYGNMSSTPIVNKIPMTVANDLRTGRSPCEP